MLQKAQKEYKTRNDCMGKVINWELCKKVRFDHTTNWFMHKLESVLKNGTQKILWDYQIQTDFLNPVKRPDLAIVNKKSGGKENLLNSGLCRLG